MQILLTTLGVAKYVLLLFDILIELAMSVRNKHKITICVSVNATGGTMNIEEHDNTIDGGTGSKFRFLCNHCTQNIA